MIPPLESLGIDNLDDDERIALAHAILDSVPTVPDDAPLSEAKKQELLRRSAAYDADPSATVPWEEVKARLLARSKR